METKKSTPINIGPSKPWNNPKGGTIWYFPIEFQDGTKGQFGSKDEQQKKFTIGKETEYTREQKDGSTDYKIDVVRTGNFGGNGGGKPFDPVAQANKDRLIVAQNALTNAVAFFGNDQGRKSPDILAQADIFYTWTMSHTQAPSQPASTTPVQTTSTQPVPSTPFKTKPDLTPGMFDKLLARVQNGEAGVIEKALQGLTINEAQLKLLRQAEMNDLPF